MAILRIVWFTGAMFLLYGWRPIGREVKSVRRRGQGVLATGRSLR
jgi:hypothetical protein